MEQVRLHKRLSQLGVASRREAERWIAEGRVSINGVTRRDQGQMVAPSDHIAVDGKRVDLKEPPRVYYMLNKPDLCLTSRHSQDDKITIFDLPRVKRTGHLLSPVGRLDFRSEGLLLLSNDGDFVHRLSHPKFKVPRHYEVLVPRALSYSQEDKLRRGVYLEDGLAKAVKLERKKRARLGSSQGMWYRITLLDGRNRIVRRMFQTQGLKVIRLLRVGFGPIKLSRTMRPGECVALSAYQIQLLKKAAKPQARLKH